MKTFLNGLLRSATGLLMCLCLFLIVLPEAYAAENTTDFFGGDGSEGNPYLVGTKEHLDHVRDYPDAHFLLVTDLAFTEADFAENGIYYNAGGGWEPIGTPDAPFSGVFSGDGHTISGVSISIQSATSVYGGLFGYSTGTIAQLNVTDVNYSVEASVTGAKAYAGGITGYNGGVIRDCSCSGRVYASVSSTSYGLDGTAYSGGVSGYNEGSIERCANSAIVRALVAEEKGYTGGIAGRSTGPIEGCTNSGVVGDTSSGVTGGIVGYSTAEIKNCSNTGEISSSSEDLSYAGGIAGYAYRNIHGCENFGSVSGSSRETSSVAYIGGIVGYAGGEISTCANHGQVYGSAYRNKISTKTYVTVHVGGIAGYTRTSITDCAQLGGVSAATWSYRPIQSSASFANVYATAYLGGIAGTSEGTVSTSYSVGEAVIYSYADKTYVNSRNYYGDGDAYVGGLVGQSSGSITDCYTAGAVCSNSKASPFVGGIVGASSGLLENCYTLGTVIGIKDYESMGAVAGESTGDVSSLYYLDLSGADVSAGTVGTPFAREDLSTQETFDGFDFVSVWRMDPTFGVPTLISNPPVSSEGSTEEFGGGCGTLFDPYLIETAAHLNNVRDYPYAYFELAADVTFSGSDFSSSGAFYNDGAYWEPISFFGGVLDGRGYSIIGLKQSLTATHGGMIAVNGGMIQDLTLQGVTITHTGSGADTYVGALTGENRGTIKDCALSSDTSVSCTLTDAYKGYAGGITGYNEGTITGCSNAGTVFSGNGYHTYTYAGGIAARNNNTVIDCTNSGKVEGRYCAGGIVAWNDENAASIQYCSNSGAVTTTAKSYFQSGDPTSSYAGGILGYGWGRTEYCYNTGAVTANGLNSGSSYDSINPYAGGIGGYGDYISNCYNTGSITAKNGYKAYAGGISGKSLSVSCCYNIGSSKAIYSQSGNYSGAIVGTGSVYSTCYYLNTASAGTGSGSDYATRCSAEMMTKQTTFLNFDFYNVWMIDAYRSYQYPVLRGNCVFTVSSLAITEAPAEPLQTVEGIAPEIEGCTVVITYDDGYSVTTQATSDMIPKLSYTLPGTRTTPLEYCGVASDETVSICVAEKTLEELLILAWPHKTVYMVGEELDTEGLYVTAIYDNGTEHEAVPESISGYDSSVGTKTIVVSYQGLTTTFEVEVCACETIEVTTLPDKVTYVQGQPLSVDGGVITATLTNGTTRTFPLSQAQITYPSDGLNSVKVTATLFDCSAEYYITVSRRVAAEMILLSAPTKTVYFLGERLDPAGGVLRVVFESEDAYTEEVPLSMDMLTGFDSTQVGYPTVTVTYCERTVTFLTRVRDYGLTAVHDGTQIAVTVSAVPDNSIILVAQYDSNGKQISCCITADTDNIALDPAAYYAYAYLTDADSFTPYISPIEILQDTATNPTGT